MNFNPFNKPPLNKIFTNGSGRTLENPAPGSHESESNLLSKLALITSFLAVMGSAEAKSPALREYNTFEEMQSKSKTEFVKLEQKMHEMGTDTIRYEAGNKKMTIINHNGATTYIEVGGGNTVTIDDENGDGVVDKIKMNGYIDGTEYVKKQDNEHKDLKPVDLKKIVVEHSFSRDTEALSKTKVSSTMSLTQAEEVKVFLSVQDKFVQGIEGAISDIENGGGALAQK